ncbi:MAG: FAD-binding oxidoreductase, partial [Oscillospiraceae bacterium]|nr:FAD-binding oxidoreductase [Oscillospiraceae bacterium]
MLFPENTQQVQEIIRKARETGRGLVPVSSEPPHFHGASENENADIVSFSKMKKIMVIDRRSRYARVEPGVTFGELIPQLRENGMRLNLPFLARSGKSAAASALEREAVMMPKYQYDYPDPLLTVETVFGTGDTFRTGSAAGPGTYEQSRADKIIPWGPGGIDYLRFLAGAQGTIGLVTWATLKTEILPSASRLFFIASDSADRLTSLANVLCRRRIPDELIILNRENFAAAFADNAEEENALHVAAPWIMLCRVCGYDRYPEERLAIYDGYVRDVCRDAGLEAVTAYPLLPGIEQKIESMITDCDRREKSWKLRLGQERELLFVSAPSKTAGLISVIENELPNAGITVSPQVQGRAFRVEVNMRFGDDRSETEKTDAALFALARKLVSGGAYFDRPYG